MSNKINKIKVNNVEYDVEDTSKQEILVSGTNIKTINNTSLLGSGNIEIGSGGTATDVQINGTSIVSDSVANILTNTAYNSSSNKIATMSDIPSEVTETTVSNWGFTKNTGTYSKPSGGIPDTDLSSAVQTSLGKADTALQSYTEQYTGTITGITMNGVSKGTSGVVDLGTVITQHQDISGKLDASKVKTSTDTTQGNVYDVTYINTMLGDVETVLTTLTTGGGVQ